VGDPTRVGELLSALPGLADLLGETRLLAAWPVIAGAAAARSRAEGIEGGLLSVAVHSSGWLHRLTLEEPVLLERCRVFADVRSIRFHLAPVPLPATAAPLPHPTPEAEAEIDAALAPVRGHPAVAEALRRAMRAELETRRREEGQPR